MKNGSFERVWQPLAIQLTQALQSMHKQLSTYLNGMWFTLLVSMASNGLLMLLVVFWVQSFLEQMCHHHCHVPSFLLLSVTSNHGLLL